MTIYFKREGRGGLVLLLETERFCLYMQGLKGIYFIDLSSDGGEHHFSASRLLTGESKCLVD